MGLVQQEVLDFDEEIQVPWRPRLVAVAGGSGAEPEVGRVQGPRPSGRSSSRVGVCRPVQARESVHRVPPRVVVASRSSRPETARSRRTARRSVRLTRRARLLATVLTLALGVAIGSWLGPLLGGGDDHLQLAGVQSVVVESGDTLWSIAQGVAGTADVRAVVDRIQELNGLRGTVLHPGQVLELP